MATYYSAEIQRNSRGDWCVIETVDEFETPYGATGILRRFRVLGIPKSSTREEAIEYCKRLFGDDFK